MNYGGDAADQIVRYSLDGIDHGLRLSGSIAKNLAVFFAAVLKDQKKTHGKTNMIRMLKDGRPLKFFTVPSDRLKEFCREGKKRGLLYVVIRDRKNPKQCEVMVLADDAAKVNRVMDKMNLDFLKSEAGEAVHDVTDEKEAPVAAQTETVEMPEGEVQFEITDFEEDFNFPGDGENFTEAQEAGGKNPSGSSSRSSGIFTEQAKETEKPSVRKELEEIKKEKETSGREKHRQKDKQKSQRSRKGRRKNKTKVR